MEKWARVKYQPNLPLYEGKYVTACAEHIALSKEAAAEGMVLLKNENHVLPLAKGTKVALFGKGSFDYVKGGGGSGDVFTKYVKNTYEGLKELSMVSIFEPLSDFYRENVKKQYEGGAAAGMTVEPEVSDALCDEAKAFAEVALIFISRFSGEGWDRSSIEYDGEYNPWDSEVTMPQISGRIFPEGDFYLSKEEEAMIEKVTARFDKVVAVLNIGGIIDTRWIKENDKISAALHAGQGGMEGGLATAEILCGVKNPSGKLSDTYAKNMDVYPSTEGFHESHEYVNYTEDIFVGYRYFETFDKAAVCYPFGYGLSYTTFSVETTSAKEENGNIVLEVKVQNTGDVPGKEVVQVYVTAPQGILGKAARSLMAFAKTKELKAGESEVLTLSFEKNSMASFDDLGKIAKSAYVLEAGEYQVLVGNNVADAACVYTVNMEQTVITEQLTSKCAPTQLEKRLCADGSYEKLPQGKPNDPNECILKKMVPGTEEAVVPEQRGRERYLLMKPYKEGVRPLMDVVEGKMTLDEFVAQMDEGELCSLLGGQPNLGVANTWGFGNLPEYGVPSVMTADGPAGVRLADVCGIATTAWPCATVLACTWNTELVEKVGKAGGEELKENNLAIWLTPAVNIHRNPMCGRNFEYYSEDPLLAGKMGAAMVRGIQSNHVAASVKHFACNNKETNRKHSDSRVSERALREIYLKVFEIIVKEANPWTIMSSYNVINGHRASENKELLEDILRGEWGFQGMVTSDWWTRGEHYKEILAGNDVKMANGYPERVKKAMELGALDRSDLEHCAKRVLELIMKID